MYISLSSLYIYIYLFIHSFLGVRSPINSCKITMQLYHLNAKLAVETLDNFAKQEEKEEKNYKTNKQSTPRKPEDQEATAKSCKENIIGLTSRLQPLAKWVT